MPLEIFQQIVVDWNQLNRNQSEQTNETAPKIEKIYKKCREIPESDRAALKSSKEIQLKKNFTDAEEGIHDLFFKTLLSEVQDDSCTISNMDPIRSTLVIMASSLSQDNDSKIVEHLKKLPTNCQNILFKNLWRVLGSPQSSDKVGEYAFLKQQGCQATPKEKLEAVILSVPSTERIMIYAGTGDTKALRSILSNASLISEANLGLAVRYVAAHGHEDALGVLLEGDRPISGEDLGLAVVNAAKNDRVDALRVLLKGKRSISERDLEWAVVNAAENGHVKALNVFFEGNREIFKRAWGLALRTAASNGHMDALRFLLRNAGDTVYNHLELAVEEAAANGHVDALRLLLPKATQIQSVDYRQSVIKAAANGHVNVLRVLFKDGRKISENNLGLAVQEAAKNGRVDALRFLFEDGRKISENNLRLAVEEAAKNGRVDALGFLLPKATKIQSFDYGQSVIKAAANGHVKALRFLFEGDRKISAEALGGAVKEAAANGHVKALGVLFEGDRQISAEALGEAVKEAAENGHVDVLRVLFKKGDRQISAEALERAVYWAAENGHGDVLRVLFEGNRQISAEALGGAVYWAARKGHMDALGVLCEGRRQISAETLGSAMEEAAKNGRVDVLRVLFGGGWQIPPETLGRAVLTSAAQGHYAVVEYLLSRGEIHRVTRDSAITQASGPMMGAIRDILHMARVIPDQIEGYVHHAPNSNSMEVSLQTITDNPIAFLQTLSLSKLPTSFQLVGSRAIDLGGVSKQVYSTLFSALKEPTNLLFLTTDDIPSIDTQGEELYKTLGRFYARFVERNQNRSDPFLTGFVFSPHFFSFIKMLHAQPDNRIELYSAFGQIIQDYSPVFAYLQDCLSIEKQDAVRNLMKELCEEGEIDEYATRIAESFTKPVIAFLEGAKEVGQSCSFLRLIESLSPEALCEKLQGQRVSAQGIIDALEITNPDQSAVFTQYVEWFKEKILSADQQWLEKLILAMTGRKVMSPGIKLKLKPTWREGLTFEFHTCFNSLDLPNPRPDPIKKKATEDTAQAKKKAKEEAKANFLVALNIAIKDNQSYNIS